MNTIENNQEHTIALLEQTYSIIQSHIENSLDSFDVFATLPSSTIWQSPIELAEKWIEGVAPEAWEYLNNIIDSTTSLEKFDKNTFKERILRDTAGLIYRLYKSPTRFQQLSTRLLIKEIMVEELPVNDQDRVIAAELATSFRTWQQILGTFSIYPELRELLQVSDPLQIVMDHDGNPGCILVYPEEQHIALDIPGIHTSQDEKIKIVEAEDGKSIIFISQIQVTHVSHSMLQRSDAILGMGDEKKAIRETVLNKFNGIPVWKKRGGGGNKPKEDPTPEGKLAWQ